MAPTSSRLQLVIAGDNKGAVRAIDDTGKRIGGLQGKLGGLGAGIAGAFSVASVVAFGKQSVSAYKDIAGNVALIKRLTGDTAEGASLLAFAAQQSGIDASKAAVAWRTLAKNIDSGKIAAEGIATSDGNGRLLSFDEILGNVADKIQALPPGFQRTALAQRLFGRSGADMVKMLAKGRQGIEDMRKEMQSYGLEFTDAGLKKYQEFVQAQRDMKAALMGVQVEVGQAVVPALTKMAEAAAFFGRLPEPVKRGAITVGLLTAGFYGLATSIGVFGPPLKAGLTTMGAIGPTATTAATGVEGLAAAQAQAAASANALAGAEATATTATEALITKLSLVQGAALVAMAAADKVHKLSESKDYNAPANLIVDPKKDAEDIAADTEKALDLSSKKIQRYFGWLKTEANFKTFFDTLEKEGASQKVIDRYRAELEKYRAANGEAADSTTELGDEQDNTAESTDNLTSKVTDLRTAQEKANDAAAKAIGQQKELTSARDAFTDATAASQRADYELGIARQEAAGNSEQYRQAEEDVADALAAVPEAQREARDAVRDLNEARKDAADRLRDLAQAERDTALASADAQLKVKEALNEQRRVNADPRASALDKERAALTVAQAQNEARNATDDAAQAARDNAEAQRKGIEGDDAVVRAKQAVIDANDGVRDAVNRVKDAEANAAQVIQDAKAKVLEAQAAATDAALTEASAWGDLVEKQYGSVAGAQAYRDKLKEIAADLDPNSPLARRLARLIEDINTAILTSRLFGPPSRGSSTPTYYPGYVAPGDAPRTPGGDAAPTAPTAPTAPAAPKAGGDAGIVLNQTNIIQGTSTQVRRAQDQQTQRTLDSLSRRLR